ncbi:MAG: helix-turn-helix transcriptional regulator [Magnetococcales bacterium]|nr:helix-turn-helix transcriptional regulator [Magnetococcales bacterium]
MDKQGLKDRIKTVIGASTIKAVAVRSDITEGALRHYLSGRSEPRCSTAAKIAQATGVSVQWLITGHGPMMETPAHLLADHEACQLAAEPVLDVLLAVEEYLIRHDKVIDDPQKKVVLVRTLSELYVELLKSDLVAEDEIFTNQTLRNVMEMAT